MGKAQAESLTCLCLLEIPHCPEVFVSLWLLFIMDGLVLLAKCLWHRPRSYQEHVVCQMLSARRQI